MPATVLVCDNEAVLRTLVRASLGDRGYEIAEARDGDELLEIARRTQPDLIILDMLMPGRSGLDVLAELRRDPTLADTPVIVLTARAQASDREAAFKAEADRFLAKPFSPRELAAMVDELLESEPDERNNGSKEPAVAEEPPVDPGRGRFASLVRERVAWAEAQATEQELSPFASAAFSGALELESARRLANLGRAVLDATEEAIRVVDTSGKEVVANAAMKRLVRELDLPGVDALYTREREFAERTTDPDRFRDELQALLDDPELVARHELELAGFGRILQRYTAPVRDSLGSVIGRIFVLRDVTGERTTERAREELIANVSHELRTPLTGILGFTEILLDQDVHPETRRRHLQAIHNEVKRLTSLTDGLLDLERLQDGRLALTLEPFRLDRLLKESVRLFSGESTAHTIALELPRESLEVVADRDRIAQVVSNLLSNAIKYSPGGGTIRVWAQRSDGRIRVAVEDPGIGIPADEQERVFSRFFRAQSSGTRGIQGLGLGLALSREIIEAHNGEIGFESDEDAGSTFWFSLAAG